MNGYMTTKEAAEKWGITQRQVQNHCKMNRIPGVLTHGTTYMIPENAERPVYGFSPDSHRKKAILKNKHCRVCFGGLGGERRDAST